MQRVLYKLDFIIVELYNFLIKKSASFFLSNINPKINFRPPKAVSAVLFYSWRGKNNK